MAADKEGSKSKILIIGATGYMGKFMVEGSVSSGHPTFALLREATASNPAKAQLIQGFNNSGVTLLYGDVDDHDKLVEAIKKVDVVISALGHESHQKLADPLKIISAIKEAGNVKRYFPSEFGYDYGRHEYIQPAKTPLEMRGQIREIIKEEGIPYTFVCSGLAAYFQFLPTIGQVEASGLPTDKISILGDGNCKVLFVAEQDTAMYTMKAVDDPRTLNKILYVRPPTNILSHNELITLWEKKSGKTFERIYMPEEEVIKKTQEAPFPLNLGYAISHAAFVKGVTTDFEIDPSIGLDACELYPEVKYRSIDEILNQYL